MLSSKLEVLGPLLRAEMIRMLSESFLRISFGMTQGKEVEEGITEE